jgi:DNA-binding response OmpR family regulator
MTDWKAVATTWQSFAQTLQVENENLRAQLAEQTAPSLIPQSVFRLTRSQAVIFSVLMHNRAPHRETFMQALYGHRSEPPEDKTLDVLICQLRRKLGAHGVEIATIWGQGFHISEESKARARQMMAAA